MLSIVQNEANQTNAAQAVLLTPQDHTEYKALESAYAFELCPLTPTERTLFAQVVLAAWNIQRTNRLEAGLAISLGIDPLLSEDKTLGRITAARNRAERTYHKCLKELRAAIAARPEPPATSQNKPNSPTNIPDAVGHATLPPTHAKTAILINSNHAPQD